MLSRRRRKKFRRRPWSKSRSSPNVPRGKPKSAPPSAPASAAPSEESPEEERPKTRAKAKAKSEPKAKAEPKTPRVAKAKAAPDQPVASPEVNPMAAMVAALHQHKERANDHRRLMYQSFLAGMAQ